MCGNVASGIRFSWGNATCRRVCGHVAGGSMLVVVLSVVIASIRVAISIISDAVPGFLNAVKNRTLILLPLCGPDLPRSF